MRAWALGLAAGASLVSLACGKAIHQTELAAAAGEGGSALSQAEPEEGGTQPTFAAGGSGVAGFGFAGGGTAGAAVAGCTPGKQECQRTLLYGCNDAGADQALLVDCAAVGRFCDPQAEGGPKCAEAQCAPGDAFCRGTTHYSCDERLRYVPTVDPVACPPAPMPQPICEPGTVSCQNGQLQTCEASGLAYRSSPCLEGWQCLDGDLVCVLNSCTAGARVCLGNQVGDCAADGLSLGSVALDCKGQGQVCSVDGACSVSVADELGRASVAGDDVRAVILLCGMVVHTDRTLTELAEHLRLTEAGKVGWLLYEWIDDGYALVLEDTTPVSAGDAMFASNPLDFQLRAGHTYVVGARVSAAGRYYTQEVFPDRKLSFANVLGCALYEGDYTAVPPDLGVTSDYEGQLRITTTLPSP